MMDERYSRGIRYNSYSGSNRTTRAIFFHFQCLYYTIYYSICFALHPSTHTLWRGCERNNARVAFHFIAVASLILYHFPTLLFCHRTNRCCEDCIISTEKESVDLFRLYPCFTKKTLPLSVRLFFNEKFILFNNRSFLFVLLTI